MGRDARMGRDAGMGEGGGRWGGGSCLRRGILGGLGIGDWGILVVDGGVREGLGGKGSRKGRKGRQG